MKKPIMKKEDLEKEYFDVAVDAICHVPLRQAAKVLGIKNEESRLFDNSFMEYKERNNRAGKKFFQKSGKFIIPFPKPQILK